MLAFNVQYLWLVYMCGVHVDNNVMFMHVIVVCGVDVCGLGVCG